MLEATVPVPIAWQPHEYQKSAIKFLLEHACAGLFLDPGLGKTSITLGAIKILKQQKLLRKVLVVAPLRVCYSVWPRELTKWADFGGLTCTVLHGGKKEALLKEDTDIYVINPEGLEWLMTNNRFKNLGIDTLVIDECFPAGSKVSTPTGQRNIEDLSVGDAVKTVIGDQRIKSVARRTVERMLVISGADGRKIICTPDHPIFTDVGWVPAYATLGRTIYGEDKFTDLSGLRERICGAGHTNQTTEEVWQREVLLKILWSEVDVAEHERSTVHETKDVREQDGATGMEHGNTMYGGNKEENFYHAEENWPQMESSWGKRNGNEPVRTDSFSTSPFIVYMELRGRIGPSAARLSYELQSRLWRSDEKDCAGSGRIVSWLERTSRTGQEENGHASETWVESVKNYEHSDNVVYNIGVEGHPSYFVEGTLVHNCSKFKHTNTRRYKTLKPVLGKFARRWILTGTPAPNGLMDLFGQVYILDMGKSFSPYITKFRQEFFSPTGFGGYTWVPKPETEERIHELLRPLTLRLEARDYIKLPKIITTPETDIVIHLPPAARKIYDDLEEEMIATLDNMEVVTALSAAAASMKCRQVANGGIYRQLDYTPATKSEAWQHIHDEKTKALEDLVEELNGQPLLVAYEFHHDVDRIRKAFPKATYAADYAAKKFPEIEAKWNAGKISLLVAQPQNVAHGLNLQEGQAMHICFYSQIWDLEVYEQFIQRVVRQGNNNAHAFVYHIVAEGTVDRAVLRSLKSKAKVQNRLLSALKDYSKERVK